MNNPDWEFAGVYVDEALTGTKGSRPQFLKMLEDCRAGKIDMILTKSLSRFARNTVTALEAIQMLRREGVNVCFEREGIYSMDKNSEFIFTILAGTAQEESLSASENQKWKIRKNFREGIPTATRMMGYEFVDGTFVVIPEEAEVVKRVFSEYLSGKGLTAICKGLIAEGVPTKNGGIWCESVIRKMLTNEKYTGDLLLQKSFVENHITKRKMVNRGQLPQYLVEDDHEAIISKSDFAMVQDEIKRRAKKYAHAPASKPCDLTGKIICEQCGGHYRRKKLRSGKIVWICSTFNRLGKAHCASQQIPDSILRSLIGDTAFSEIRIPCLQYGDHSDKRRENGHAGMAESIPCGKLDTRNERKSKAKEA